MNDSADIKEILKHSLKNTKTHPPATSTADSYHQPLCFFHMPRTQFCLTLCILGKNFSTQHFEIFFLIFPRK